jgi:hypothetical protein
VKLRRWLPVLVVVALVVLAAADAHACSVCFDTNSERRAAFLATAMFLTLTPIAFVLGVVWWLVRRARALDAAPPAE